MKSFRLALITTAIVGLASLNAFSEGNSEKGITFFDDPRLGGSTNAISCGTCHSGGKGLMGVAEKEKYTKTGNVDKALGEVVNQCIEKALKGKPLDSDSVELQDIVAYLKTLK